MATATADIPSASTTKENSPNFSPAPATARGFLLHKRCATCAEKGLLCRFLLVNEAV